MRRIGVLGLLLALLAPATALDNGEFEDGFRAWTINAPDGSGRASGSTSIGAFWMDTAVTYGRASDGLGVACVDWVNRASPSTWNCIHGVSQDVPSGAVDLWVRLRNETDQNRLSPDTAHLSIWQDFYPADARRTITYFFAVDSGPPYRSFAHYQPRDEWKHYCFDVPTDFQNRFGEPLNPTMGLELEILVQRGTFEADFDRVRVLSSCACRDDPTAAGCVPTPPPFPEPTVGIDPTWNFFPRVPSLTDVDPTVSLQNGIPRVYLDEDAPRDDLDADGIADMGDLCPFAWDPMNGDSDADGAGDACDADVDDDTELEPDSCPLDGRGTCAVLLGGDEGSRGLLAPGPVLERKKVSVASSSEPDADDGPPMVLLVPLGAAVLLLVAAARRRR